MHGCSDIEEVKDLFVEGKNKFDLEFDYCIKLDPDTRVFYKNALQYDHDDKDIVDEPEPQIIAEQFDKRNLY